MHYERILVHKNERIRKVPTTISVQLYFSGMQTVETNPGKTTTCIKTVL